MNEYRDTATRPQGVVVTIKDIYTTVNDIQANMNKVKDIASDVSDHESRIRELFNLLAKLQSQLAVLWIINTIVVAAITAIVSNALTGGN